MSLREPLFQIKQLQDILFVCSPETSIVYGCVVVSVCVMSACMGGCGLAASLQLPADNAASVAPRVDVCVAYVVAWSDGQVV